MDIKLADKIDPLAKLECIDEIPCRGNSLCPCTTAECAGPHDHIVNAAKWQRAIDGTVSNSPRSSTGEGLPGETRLDRRDAHCPNSRMNALMPSLETLGQLAAPRQLAVKPRVDSGDTPTKGAAV